MKAFLSSLVGVILAILVVVVVLYMEPSIVKKVISADGGNNIEEENKTPEDRVKNISIKDLEEQMVNYENIKTNLKDGYYVSITVSTVTDSKDSAKEADKRSFQIRSYLIKKLGEMDSSQLKSNKSVERLLKETKKYLNGQMETGEIIKIYVTEKIIQ